MRFECCDEWGQPQTNQEKKQGGCPRSNANTPPTQACLRFDFTASFSLIPLLALSFASQPLENHEEFLRT